MSRIRFGLTLGSLLLAACAPLAPAGPGPDMAPASVTPAAPSLAPIIMCTPPPCQADESYICRSGDCPGGCGTGCATHTPAAPTDTYPPPMCTPPACWSGEAYFCAGECPGGCGTTCATHTPDPGASPLPPFPAAETLCAPAGAGLARCASTETAPVGERFTVLAEAAEATNLIFVVQGQDQTGYGGLSLRVKAPDQTQGLSNGSQVVRLVSAQVSGRRLLLTLEALAAGQLELRLAAGQFTGGFVDAEPLLITVTTP